MQSVHIKIHGRVHGVFFRAHTQDVASKLALTGWVRNTEDGGVETVAIGTKNQLEKFITWCRQGPPSAKVDDINVEWKEAKDEFKEFSIRY